MGRRFIRRVVSPVIAGLLIIATAAACSSHGKLISADDTKTATKESAAKLTVTPKANAGDVPVSAELTAEVDKGELTGISLKDSNGKTVDGEMRDDDSSWVPAEPLEYETSYVVTATAVDDEDIEAVHESTFTTMSSPGNRMSASLWNSSEISYGHAMPIMVNFPSEYSVPEDMRDEVEKRLFVEAEPKQPGAWHWFNGHHLEYRPKEFWEPGSQIKVRLGLGGLPLGGDLYGATDVTSTVKIADTVKSVEVDDKTKQLVAYENGEAVKKMDVSLGKKGHPSYSGTMIVMEKEKESTFDTTNEPGCNGKEDGKDCYITDVEYAQRLTWSGQYIHAAPWSVGDQGERNVSHGCVNISDANAKWIYDFTLLGTPVDVHNTGHELPYGDGYTAFDLSWEEFLEGSYLPPPGEASDDESSGEEDTPSEGD